MISASFSSTRKPLWRRARSQTAVCGSVLAALAAASAGLSQPVLADLKLCNATSVRIGVALGYQDGKGWATEGWWNIAGKTCETLLKGTISSRFYYVHAVDYDRGGEWAGPSPMCTADTSFLIHGAQDCQHRGYKRTGFFEIDTNDAKDWTIRLTDPIDAGATAKAK